VKASVCDLVDARGPRIGGLVTDTEGQKVELKLSFAKHRCEDHPERSLLRRTLAHRQVGLDAVA